MGVPAHLEESEVLQADGGRLLVSAASDLSPRVEGRRWADEAEQVAPDLMLVLFDLAVRLVEVEEIVQRATLRRGLRLLRQWLALVVLAELRGVIQIPSSLLILGLDVGPPSDVVAVQRRRKVARLPPCKVHPIDILIRP